MKLIVKGWNQNDRAVVGQLVLCIVCSRANVVLSSMLPELGLSLMLGENVHAEIHAECSKYSPERTDARWHWLERLYLVLIEHLSERNVFCRFLLIYERFYISTPLFWLFSIYLGGETFCFSCFWLTGKFCYELHLLSVSQGFLEAFCCADDMLKHFGKILLFIFVLNIRPHWIIWSNKSNWCSSMLIRIYSYKMLY